MSLLYPEQELATPAPIGEHVSAEAVERRLLEAGRLSLTAAREAENAVSAILTSSQAAARELTGTHAASDHLREIDVAARSLKRLVKSLLVLNQIPAPERAAVIDLDALIRQSLLLLRTASRGPVEYAQGASGAMVYAEAARLLHMFTLLVTYADSASDGHRAITLSLETSQTEASIAVAYSPAERNAPPADAATASAAPWFGMAVAASIVRDHEGVLEIRGASAGWEVFIVRLPLADKSADGAQ